MENEKDYYLIHIAECEKKLENKITKLEDRLNEKENSCCSVEEVAEEIKPCCCHRGDELTYLVHGVKQSIDCGFITLVQGKAIIHQGIIDMGFDMLPDEPENVKPDSYQQWVVYELFELSKKCNKLGQFIGSNHLYDLYPHAEQDRLAQQYNTMREYEKILKERIENFPT